MTAQRCVLLVIVLSLFTSRANAQCFTASTSCVGPNVALTTAEECCVGDGDSYLSGSVCQICYVFGYVAGTRVQTLPEGMDSDLTIGVVKPPAGIGLQFPLNFLIQNADNTGDVRVGGQGVQPGGILFGSVRREDSFTIRAEVDDIGQEGVETFSIPLTINPSLNPPPVSVFVTGDAAITVIDTTEVTVALTEADYLQREGQRGNVIIATVLYNREIVNPITVTITPATYTQYDQVFMRTLPVEFPTRETGAEFEAKVIDFVGDPITITLPRPGGGTNRQVAVNIPIIDDAINEHQETLVGFIEITEAIDTDTIILGRSAAQLIINDNDEITIGFTEESYTFTEGQANAAVTLAKDSGVISERNDIAVRITLLPDPTATQNSDFSITMLDVRIDFDPGAESIDVPINVLEDALPEGVESFRLRVASDDFGFGAERMDTFQDTEVFITDNMLGQESFSCYESTDCHGAVVETELPLRGECCAGNGLSLSLTGSTDDCRNCFSMEEFCRDGSVYYVAFFSNLLLHPVFSRATISVLVNNMEETEQSVVVTYEGGRKDILLLGPGASEKMDIPIDMRFGSVGERDKGVVVQSVDGARFSVTAFGGEFTSSDTYQILPCVHLPSNYEYYAVSVAKDNRILEEDDVQYPADPRSKSVVVFIASENNTRVTLTPSRDVEVDPGVITLGGTTIELTLKKGESVFLSGKEDLTGTRVVSNKPLAFFSGHECGNMPSDMEYCDHMVEQLPPTATWGTEFYTASFMTRPRDRYRAVSSRDNNSIAWSCVGDDQITDERDIPRAGEAIEFEILANKFCRFVANFPVLLVQFSVGGNRSRFADPSMTVVPPIAQYKSSYMLNYFPGFSASNYVNIILLTTEGIATSGTLLDGSSFNGTWREIYCDNGGCVFGVQVMVEVGKEVVTLAHNDPDAKLLGVPYSTDVRTGRATFAGMTQKPIALDRVSLSGSEYTVEEGSGEVLINITRSGELIDDIIVIFVAREIPGAINPAIGDEDFTQLELELTLPAGEAQLTVPVALGPDNIFPGPSKEFEVYLGPAPGAFVSPTAFANVTITDNDPDLPVMNISVTQIEYSVEEGEGFFELTLIKSDGGVGPVSVSLTPVPSSALSGTDYEFNETTITFEAAERIKVVQVVILNDDILERNESFDITIQPLEGPYPLAVVDSLVAVDITDNDFMLLGFTTASTRVNETVGSVDIELAVLRGGTDHDVTVLVMIDSFTANQSVMPITLTPFTRRVLIQVDVEEDDECGGKMLLSVLGESTEREVLVLNEVNITIIDNDCFPVVAMSVSQAMVLESEGEVNVIVTADTGGMDGSIRLGLSTIPISPKSTSEVGVDALTQSELVFTRSDSQQISISVVNNDVYDGAEQRTFNVCIALLGSDFERVDFVSECIEVSIKDDEPPPEEVMCNIDGAMVSVPTNEQCCVTSSGISYEQSSYTIPCIVIGFDMAQYVVQEREEPYQFSLRVLGGSLAQNITLTITSTPITAAGDDYTVLYPWVKLEENGTGTMRVAISMERGQEDRQEETFRLDLREETGITPKNVFFRQALVTITDTSLARS